MSKTQPSTPAYDIIEMFAVSIGCPKKEVFDFFLRSIDKDIWNFISALLKTKNPEADFYGFGFDEDSFSTVSTRFSAVLDVLLENITDEQQAVVIESLNNMSLDVLLATTEIKS